MRTTDKTLKLNIPSETEAKLCERAASAGQDVATFVLEAVAEKLAEADPPPTSSRNGDDWTDRLRACIDLHPVVTYLVDDSRESIYVDRGE